MDELQAVVETIRRWVFSYFVPWRATTSEGGDARYRRMIPRLGDTGKIDTSFMPNPLVTDGNIQVGGLIINQKIRAIAATALADDATATLTTAGRGLIYIVRASGNQHFLGFFSSGGVTEVSDPSGTWVQADTDGNNCIYWSSGLVLKNRTGSAQTYYYQILGDISIT